jgi:hypothetical protein
VVTTHASRSIPSSPNPRLSRSNHLLFVWLRFSQLRGDSDVVHSLEFWGAMGFWKEECVAPERVDSNDALLFWLKRSPGAQCIAFIS